MTGKWKLNTEIEIVKLETANWSEELDTEKQSLEPGAGKWKVHAGNCKLEIGNRTIANRRSKLEMVNGSEGSGILEQLETRNWDLQSGTSSVANGLATTC